VSVVCYRPVDAQLTDGLELAAGKLRAYRAGDVVGEADAPAGSSLGELLGSYRAVELLPELEFSRDGTRREIDVEISLDFSLPLLVMGSMSDISDRRRGLWQAARVGSNDFLRQDDLPAGARPWAAQEKRGYGWEIVLPAFITAVGDPVFSQRAGLAIEALIYALLQDREIDLPYRRRITNVFSAQRPTWSVPLPMIRNEWS